MNDIENLFQHEIPEHVIEKAKLALLDYIAVTLAGTTGIKTKLDRFLELEKPEPGNTTTIGLKRK